MTSGKIRKYRAALAVAIATTLGATIAVTAPIAQAASTHAVSNATLAWTYNQYAQYGVFGAWSQTVTGANVTIKEWDGEEITGLSDEAGKAYKGAEFTGGHGTIDEATGAGQIVWDETGDWVLNAYQGQFGAPDETLRDPILTIDEDGVGELSFEAYIPPALDMGGNPTEAVGPERIVLATFTDVSFDGETLQATPDFAGRPYTLESGEVASAWQSCDGVGGSWPSEWINFVPESVRPHYYTTSCSGLNLRKPPTRIDVSFELSPLAVITQHPQDASVEEGKLATFSVAATNGESSGALSYAWQSSTDGETWTPINGATQSSYSVVGRVIASGTQYRAVVTNENGVTESQPATLTVTAPAVSPQITLSVSDFASDRETTVTVTASGFDPSYVLGTRPPLAGTSSGVYVAFGRFAANWKPSSGAASSARPAAAVKWAVLEADRPKIGGTDENSAVLNADGSFTLTLPISRAAADELSANIADGQYGIYTYPGGGGWQPAYETFTPITFQPLVDVTEQPELQRAKSGESVTFSVAYESPTNVSVQWQVSTDDGATWEDIPGANADQYTITNVTSAANGYLYRARFDNAGGTEYSQPAVLVVRLAGLELTTQPVAQLNVSVGKSKTLRVAAQGQFVTYQWQELVPGATAWRDITDATTAKLVVKPSQVAQSGTQYRVVAANPAGEQISNSTTLTVTKASAKVKAALGKKKARSGKRVKVTAQLKSPAQAAGRVRVTFAGMRGKAKGVKVVRTVKVSQAGKAVAKSPKLRTGKYRVSVRYLGTDNIAATQVKKVGAITVR